MAILRATTTPGPRPQANARMETEMLEAQLERARKDNLALRRRLEAAAAGAGARANPALLRVAQARRGPGTPPPALTRAARARHGMLSHASHPVHDMRALQGMVRQRWHLAGFVQDSAPQLLPLAALHARRAHARGPLGSRPSSGSAAQPSRHADRVALQDVAVAASQEASASGQGGARGAGGTPHSVALAYARRAAAAGAEDDAQVHGRL